MPVMKVGPGRALLGGGGNYNDLVMGTGPIAYWPQSESSGLTAYCLTNPAMNGTYTGVTLANDNTGPFGTPAPFYDGANDYLNVLTAALTAAFPWADGTFMAWARVANAGVWTDAALRFFNMFHSAIGTDRRSCQKSFANNTLTRDDRAGGGICSANVTPVSPTTWFHTAHTWSDGTSTDEDIFYYQGAPVAAACTNLNNSAGALTGAFIGVYSAIPQFPWHGWLAHAALWNRVLTPAEILDLATV